MVKTLSELGIMKAITQARKMVVEWRTEDLEFLMSWCSTETPTFIALWGEFGLTLEGVSILTSLPFFW